MPKIIDLSRHSVPLIQIHFVRDAAKTRLLASIQAGGHFVYKCHDPVPVPAVSIVEVSPRDGLQNEKGFVETADKLALIDRLVAFGARRIEVASFVNPRRVPQMADAEAVVAGPARTCPACAISACASTNAASTGRLRRAMAARAAWMKPAVCWCRPISSASSTRARRWPMALSPTPLMLKKAKAAGLFAQVTISAAFGCPYEGQVPAQRIVDLAARMADAGAQEIALADTIGVGVPSQVGDLVGAVIAKIGDMPMRLHLHDTRGLAPANAWAGYEAGCRTFDSALGGLGGCPFAPGAAGNVGTEELLYLFGRSGVATGLRSRCRGCRQPLVCHHHGPGIAQPRRQGRRFHHQGGQSAGRNRVSYRLGVDVGGTFTDLLVIDEATGRTFRDKVPSTPHDPSQAVIAGARQLCGKAGIEPHELALFLHGTTVATNAVLEHKIARVGLIVTEGYRHVLQIARSLVPGGLAAWIVWPKPEPMAPLEATIEAPERIGADGEIVRPLDEAQVARESQATRRGKGRGDHRLPDQQLHERRARTPRRRNLRRSIARYSGQHQRRHPARNAGI